MFNRPRAVSCFSSDLEGCASVERRVTSGARVAHFFFARFPWQTEVKERKKRRDCSQCKYITEHANIFSLPRRFPTFLSKRKIYIVDSVLNGNREVICECTRAVNALNLQSGFPALQSSCDQQPSVVSSSAFSVLFVGVAMRILTLNEAL